MSSVMRFDEWQDSNGVPVLDGTGLAIPSSALPTGTVLQVVQTVKTDAFTSTSTSYATVTGLTATITPRATSSKILVHIQANVSQTAPSADQSSYFRMFGGNTGGYIGDTAGSRELSAFSLNEFANMGKVTWPMALTFLDSPNTTSPVTYGLEGRRNNSTAFVVNRSGTDTDNVTFSRYGSTITLMEVAD